VKPFMRMRSTLIMATAALFAATPALGQYTLNVRDADVRAFIQDAARVMDRTFIIDSRVQGKVSVVTDRPLSRSEYFEIFLSTLRANGLGRQRAGSAEPVCDRDYPAAPY
jgi:general secretion pathway protein D